MVLTVGYRIARRKTCPTVTLSTTNPIWTDRLSCVVTSLLSELLVRSRTTGTYQNHIQHGPSPSQNRPVGALCGINRLCCEDELRNLREGADFPSA
jgi:hypothetical protein